MRKVNFTAAAVVLASLWIGNVKADPPAPLTPMDVSPALIACDTREEIDTVLAAIRGGTYKQTMLALGEIKDSYGEAVCLFSPLNGVVFGEAEHIGQINEHNRTVNVWVVHAGNAKGAFFIIWGELVKTSSL